MTNVTAEITTKKPNALAKSFRTSDVFSAGRLAHINTMAFVAPIITEKTSRLLLALYLIS
ncbi:MAG: hypothetical protein WBM80_03055 [Woeseiaceae bacterium]